MAEVDKFKFFEVCAQHQNYILEQTSCKHIYDNSLDADRIPRKAYELHPEEQRIKEWYREFMQNKYRYFTLLLKDTESADQEINQVLENEAPRWTSILDHWRKQADKEQLAYLYRIIQIEEQTVDSFWYNDLPEFKEWARLCRKQLSATTQSMVSGRFSEVYRELENRIKAATGVAFKDEYIRTLAQGRITQGITSSVSAVVSHLCGERPAGEQTGKIEEYFKLEPQVELGTTILAPVTQRVIERVSLMFLELVLRGIYQEEHYIEQFLRIIKNEFKCDLCDYLEVRGGDQSIMLVSTTVDLEAMARKYPEKTEEQRREELSENQSYNKGEGISGSILLWRSLGSWFHVGSNNLSEDPRKSIWKQELYEELYSDYLKGGQGKIHNFWTFPIVIEDRLVAAFRVVNKLNESEDGLVPGSWPLFVRLQLCIVAQWFSKFWEYIKSFREMSRPDLAARISKWDSFIIEVRKQLDLAWVSKIFLSELLEHLQSLTLQKIERKGLSCSIVVLQDKDLRGFFASFDEYRSIKVAQIKELSNLTKYYDKVSCDKAAFVFNQEGHFKGIVNIIGKSASDSEHSISETTKHWNSVAFLVEEARESILFYHNGVKVADCFLYRRVGHGTWKIRYYFPTLHKIYEAVDNIPKAVLERIYKQAWQLSYYQSGAGIIIAEDIEKYFKLENRADYEELEQSVLRMDTQTFADLAKRDGSVVLTPDGIVNKAGIYPHAIKHIDISDALRDLIDRDQRGGRHRSAAEVCCACRKAIIFVVSENRGISVLYNGRALAWDF